MLEDIAMEVEGKLSPTNSTASSSSNQSFSHTATTLPSSPTAAATTTTISSSPSILESTLQIQQERSRYRLHPLSSSPLRLPTTSRTTSTRITPKRNYTHDHQIAYQRYQTGTDGIYGSPRGMGDGAGAGASAGTSAGANGRVINNRNKHLKIKQLRDQHRQDILSLRREKIDHHQSQQDYMTHQERELGIVITEEEIERLLNEEKALQEELARKRDCGEETEADKVEMMDEAERRLWEEEMELIEMIEEMGID